MVQLICRCTRCPACGGNGISGYHKPVKAVVVCEGPKLCEGRLLRKQCRNSDCCAIIGTNYYYIPNYISKHPPAAVGVGQEVGHAEWDDTVHSHQEAEPESRGRAKMRDIVFFHDRHEPFVMVNTHLFVQVRYLEQMLVEVVRRRAPIEALSDVLLQTAAVVESKGSLTWLPSRQLHSLAAYLDKKGQWLQAALDLFMVIQKTTQLVSPMQLQQQQHTPRKLFILVHSLSIQEQQAETAAAANDNAAPDRDEDSEHDLTGLSEDETAGHTCGRAGEDDIGAAGNMPFAAYEAAAADGIVAKEGRDETYIGTAAVQGQQCTGSVCKGLYKGTLEELVRQLFVQPSIQRCGPELLQDHRRCFNPASCPPGQPHHMVLILDCTTNIMVRACAVPGCKEPPIDDHKQWCKDHAVVSNGCQVAVLQEPSSGQPAWQPCSQQALATYSTCSMHQPLENKGGVAASYEARGSGKPGQERRDKAGRELQEYQRHKSGASCWPPTPQPTRTRSGRARTPQGSNQAVDTPDELHLVAGPAGVPGTSGCSVSSDLLASTVAGLKPENLAGGRSASTSHAAAHSTKSVAVFSGGKTKRPVLVCSCAHCGGVVGFDLLWHGAPETSNVGLNDVLEALECILQRLLKVSLVPAHTTAMEAVVVLYNDAVAMSAYMQQLAGAGGQAFRAVQEHVKWAIDPFRYQPPYTSASQQAATGALDKEFNTPQPLKKQKTMPGPGVSTAGDTAGTSCRTASPGMCTPGAGQLGAHDQHAAPQTFQNLLALSPFRPSLEHVIWRYVRLQNGTVLERAITRLLKQLPRDLSPDWRQQLALGGACLGNAPLCKLLARASGARIRPGLVSFAELKQHLVNALNDDGEDGKKKKTQLTTTGLTEQLQVCHNRLFFRFTPPLGTLNAWAVGVIEVLVDAEAVEGLWRKLQPGSTTGLKTQTHGFCEWVARLMAHDAQQGMYQQYLWESLARDIRADLSRPVHELPSYSKWSQMSPRLKPLPNMVTGPQVVLQQLEAKTNGSKQRANSLAQQVQNLQRQLAKAKREALREHDEKVQLTAVVELYREVIESHGLEVPNLSAVETSSD